ncbi:MAG TPA: pilin [Candidatus Paceibacterota bacterium]
MIKKYWWMWGLAAMFPYVVFAAAGKLQKLIEELGNIVGSLIPIFVGLALLYFIWNVISLIRSEDEGKREEAKKGMWWGIVALFVIVSIWGITRFIREILGVGGDSNISYPHLPDSNNSSSGGGAPSGEPWFGY